MAKKTRLYPASLCAPAALSDAQVSSLEIVLAGFRKLFDVLDDRLPAGEPKEEVVRLLSELKLRADSVVRNHVPRLSSKRIADLFADVEFTDQRVVKVVMNAHDFADFRTLDDVGFSPSLDRHELAAGLYGRAWGAEIRVSRNVIAHHIVLIGDKDDVEVPRDWTPKESQLIAI